MPYNTRRKSLSLPSLGIQLPNTIRPHRSNSKPDSPQAASSGAPAATPSDTDMTSTQDHSPPAKRLKREHGTPSPLPSPRRTPSTDLTASKPQPIPQPRKTTGIGAASATAHTPPPSPGDEVIYRKIDLSGISDDVVVSCIEQLEKTANRPHLLKELATVLMTTNRNIANSANPAALLSSRLTTYMKRDWTALSPCPIAKELVPVHPRKVFFFLTSRPRGELPANSDDIIAPAISDIKRLTPSITDPSVEDEEALERHERMQFSPSPEVELFSPELSSSKPIPAIPTIPVTPGSSYSGRSLHEEPIEPPRRQRPSNRAPSPTLEADERGFTETASAVRASRLSQQASDLQINVQQPEEPRYQAEHEVASSLFGKLSGTLSTSINDKHHLMSSPMMIPKHNLSLHIRDIDMDLDEPAWNIKSPEAISFDELDQMFDDL